MTQVWHCQICEREIRAKSGLIAHHGYQRPGEGWQTSSCFGARYRPIEVSNEAMKHYRDILKDNWIPNKEKTLANNLASPPETLMVRKEKFGYATSEMITLVRPEGFDPNNKPICFSMSQKYEMKYFRMIDGFRRDLVQMNAELERIEKRIKNWKPTTKA